MRTVFLPILLILIPLNIVSQDFPIDTGTGKISYQSVVLVDSINKEKLFVAGMEWVALAFKSAQDVIQFEDKDAGKIICKGSNPIDPTGQGMKGTIHTKHAGALIYFNTDFHV